jgi:hypothetical protein
MKKSNQLAKLTVILIILFSNVSLAAQQPPNMQDGRERIEAAKTAYLTRKMQLTKEEARVFWPVFDAYQEKMKEVRNDRSENIVSGRSELNKMTDEQINEMIDTRLNNAEKAIALRKQLIDDLREILPPAKIAIFLQAEHQFNRELQQRINQRRSGEMPRRRR